MSRVYKAAPPLSAQDTIKTGDLKNAEFVNAQLHALAIAGHTAAAHRRDRLGVPRFERHLADEIKSAPDYAKGPRGALLGPRGIWWQAEAAIIAMGLTQSQIPFKEALRWFEDMMESGEPARVCALGLAAAGNAVRRFDAIVDDELSVDNVTADLATHLRGLSRAAQDRLDAAHGAWASESRLRLVFIAALAAFKGAIDEPASAFAYRLAMTPEEAFDMTDDEQILELLAQLSDDNATVAAALEQIKAIAKGAKRAPLTKIGFVKGEC